jgi:gamma-glutamylcyclotransferase (GGCT)/AIG2-like uncharacterized protein YtfP
MSDLSCLFVYGTLMPDIPSPASAYLRARARDLGRAYLPGFLYDMGSYPGFVYAAAASQLVRGHLMQLHDPATLAELDRYEGLHEDPPEYERRALEIDGRPAWVYCYLGPTAGLPLIRSGDYATYYPRQPRHLAFIQAGR